MGRHVIGIAFGFVLGLLFARRKAPLASGRLTGRLRAAAVSAKQSVANAVGRETPLEELTRDELYERAKEADLPGRSEMTKDDLVEALRRAEGERN
jgi:Rho termination factor-like protein